MVHPELLIIISAIDDVCTVLRRDGKHDCIGVHRLIQTQKVLMLVSCSGDLVFSAMMIMASVISALDMRVTLR